MAGIKDLYLTAANNTARFPERQQPSTVNDGLRALEADLRSWYNDVPWVEYGDGDGPATIAYVSSTQFKVSSTADLTGVYHVGRRVRATGAVTGTIYGVISASSFASSETTVTVAWDSGSLSNESLAVALGLPKTNTPLPDKLAWLDRPNTFVGNQAVTGDFDVTPSPSTGTATIAGNSTSSTATQSVFSLRGWGYNASSAAVEYGRIIYVIDNATAGSEGGHVSIQAAVGGTLATRMEIGNGAKIGSPTGGLKGDGTLNATAIYVNDVAVVTTARNVATGTGLTGGGDLSADRTIAADIASQAEAEGGIDNTKLMTPLRTQQNVNQAIAALPTVQFSKQFIDTDQAIPTASSYLVTRPHGLGTAPKMVSSVLVCQSADAGFAANELVPIEDVYTDGSGAPCTVTRWDGTNVKVAFTSAGFRTKDPAGGGGTVLLDKTKWKLRIQAWA